MENWETAAKKTQVFYGPGPEEPASAMGSKGWSCLARDPDAESEERCLGGDLRSTIHKGPREHSFCVLLSGWAVRFRPGSSL